MMKSFLAGGVALVLVAAAPAHAQSFQGPYVGVQGGWNKDEVRTPQTAVGRLPIDQSRDSFTGGIFAGYDYRILPKVVVGVEGSMDFGADDAVVGNGENARIDPRFSFDIGARAGYVVADKTLLYVRGSYKNVQATVRRYDVTASGSHDTFDGWSVGGGVERAVTNHISARLEYRYSDLSEDGGRFQQHQALAGVAYHF
jgi:outer membrane immunogenic protein